MWLGVEGVVDSGVNRQEAQTRSSCATLPVKRKRLSFRDKAMATPSARSQARCGDIFLERQRGSDAYQ